MHKKKIAGLISQRRNFLNLSQVDVAEMAGTNVKTIFQLEKGVGNPSFDTLEAVANVLGLEINLTIKPAGQ